MLEKRFGLSRRPFPAAPDETLYYPASGHEAALSSVCRAMDNEEGLALLTGLPGVGKTLLGFCLNERLGETFATAFVSNSHLADRAALFQAILFDLGLPFEGSPEQVLRLRLTDHILRSLAGGKGTVVILDEAQHLTADLLEELRLLGNLEAGGKKAIQIVLLSQPSVLDALRRPELAALSQRLSTRTQVEPLGVEEAVDYLLHQLRAAGGKPEKIIDDAGLEVLARGAQGIPRLLNQAGRQALTLADAGDLSIVDAEAALESLSTLGLEANEESGAEDTSGVSTFRLSESTRLTA